MLNYLFLSDCFNHTDIACEKSKCFNETDVVCPPHKQCCKTSWDEANAICWPLTLAGKYARKIGVNVQRLDRYCTLAGKWQDVDVINTTDPADNLDPNFSGDKPRHDDENHKSTDTDTETETSTQHTGRQPLLNYTEMRDKFNAKKTFYFMFLYYLSLSTSAIAIMVWLVIWAINRHRSPYRYASFIFLFTSLVLAQVSSLTWMWWILRTLMVNCSLLVYLVFCVRISLRQTLSCAAILYVILSAVFLPIFFLAFFHFLGLPIEYGEQPTLFFIIPDLLILFTVILLDIVILFFSFLLDNNRYKDGREHRLIRYSSVSVLILALYLACIEILEMLTLSPLGAWVFEHFELVRVMDDMLGFISALLLCFLDLEIIAAFPCACVSLEDAQTSQEFLPLSSPDVERDQRYGTLPK